MENKHLYIGSHVSMSGPDFYLGSVKEALSYGSTTFMFYTGAPQNSFRKSLDTLKIEQARQLIKEKGINESKIIVHAPYIINLANPLKPDLLETSKEFIIRELQRTEGFGASILVLHPGNHMGVGKEESIKTLVNCLDDIFSKDGTNVKIAIETMAGKGTEIGSNFNEIKDIISLSKYPNRLGVCLDTCHISDAGYDVKNVNKIIDEFDDIVGLENLLVVHLNDSKNEIGAHKDRHENLGYGYLGFETLYKFVHHPKLLDIPKILETPYINQKPPYKQEISMLLSGQYVDNWKDEF
jgi:deoxyribonuclease-4